MPSVRTGLDGLISDTFWSNTVSNAIAGLAVLLIAWLINLAWKRFAQRKLTKAQRLKARLEKHRRELRNLGGVALQQIFFLILQMILVGFVTAWLFIHTSGGFLSLVADGATLSVESLRRPFLFLINLPTAFMIWSLIAIAGPVRRTLLLTVFSDWQERHLINRIKEVEPGWQDIDF